MFIRFVQIAATALMLMAAAFYSDQVPSAQGKLHGAVLVDGFHDPAQEDFGKYVGAIYNKRATFCGKIGHIGNKPVEMLNEDTYVDFDFKAFFFQALGLYQGKRSIDSITKEDLCPTDYVYDYDGIVCQGYVGSISSNAADIGSSTPAYLDQNYGSYYKKGASRIIVLTSILIFRIKMPTRILQRCLNVIDSARNRQVIQHSNIL